MSIPSGSQSLIEWARQLVAEAREILPDARIVLRKPGALIYIILTAHRAQITLGILLVFLILLAPIIVDFITGIVIPPETSKKVFGLIRTHQTSPLKDIADVVIMTVLWLVSIVSGLLLFWLHIPRGLARANAYARRILAAGDTQYNTTKGRTLYRCAAAIVTDPDLKSDIDALINEGAISSASESNQGATIIETNQANMTRTEIPVSTFRSAAPGEEHSSREALSGRYALGPELGRGAMGVVFRAWDNVLDRKVAVKQLSVILSGEDEYASRFRREAKALARLTHPNVVQVYDLIEDGNRLWMVLEFVDGGDLASYLKAKGHLPVSEAAKIVIPVAEGLAFAHGQGIIHRDLKPANILLTSEHDPKISDFGIAKLSQSSQLTQVGSVLGSPRYMSPEQCSGATTDKRTDVYSLGVTLYELLSGKVPFDGDTSSVLSRHIVEPPRPLSEIIDHIPDHIEELVLRMLAKSPDERPADMTEVIDSLSIYSGEVSSAKGV